MVNIHNLESYRVRSRRGTVDFIAEAIEASGMRLVDKADHREAPFVFVVETAGGERLTLVCYAFTANKYHAKKGERPADEHRFQIKYGSDFKRYHQLFLSKDARVVTLFFGVHLERKLLVACDPRMHSPTWFSKSVEFKDASLKKAKRVGWFGWERERKIKRASSEKSELNYRSEALLACRPKEFARYVMLERMTSGLDAGERLLHIEGLAPPSGKPKLKHRLERELRLTSGQILDMVEDHFRLLVAVRGATAERHLESHLNNLAGLRSAEPLDGDGQPDFKVVPGSGRTRTIECKNVLRGALRKGVVGLDFQRTRSQKNNPAGRYYSPDEFDIVAACLHPHTGRWEFVFALASDLEKHPKYPGRVYSRIPVMRIGEGPVEERLAPPWTRDLIELL